MSRSPATRAHSIAAAMDLTEEQRRRIEQKRREAMAIREAKRAKPEPVAQVVSTASPFAAKSTLASAARPATLPPSKASPYFSSKPTGIPVTASGSATAPKSASTVTKPVASKSKKKILVTLDSVDRLKLSFGYDSGIIAKVKKLKTCSFDPVEKVWTLALEEYKNLVEQLKGLTGSDIALDADSLPIHVAVQILGARNDKPVDLSERLPKDLVDNMFPFQREGVKFAIRREGRCMIADDMGLGKTVQALAVAYWYRNDWPLVIVCPASVTRTWQQAIQRWMDFVRPDDIEIAESPSSFPKTRIVIMSYDRLTRSREDVLRRNANFVIFDESHHIKTHGSQRTNCALAVAKAAKRVILLSGTPALSRPIELYTQIQAINPKLFSKQNDFGVRYCSGHLRSMGPRQVWDFKGCSNSAELRILLESTVMIRRLKADVLQDLPKKSRTIVRLKVDLSQEEEKENRKFHDRLAGDLGPPTAGDRRKELMEWYNSTASIKIPAVLSYVELKLKRVQKLLVFGYHRVMIEALCTYLESKRISYVVITGETSNNVRQECCNLFQARPDVRVAVLSVVAAGVGLTLTAAHEVIFTELFWNPGILIQAEDRAHRIGQEEKVAIEYLLAKGTADDVIWPMVEKKLTVLNKVGLSEDSMANSASRDKNQSVMEDYFSKTKTKEESHEATAPTSEQELLDLFDDDLLEEEPVSKFSGDRSFGEADGGASSSAKVDVPSDEDVFDDDGLFDDPSDEIVLD